MAILLVGCLIFSQELESVALGSNRVRWTDTQHSNPFAANKILASLLNYMASCEIACLLQNKVLKYNTKQKLLCSGIQKLC